MKWRDTIFIYRRRSHPPDMSSFRVSLKSHKLLLSSGFPPAVQADAFSGRIPALQVFACSLFIVVEMQATLCGDGWGHRVSELGLDE